MIETECTNCSKSFLIFSSQFKRSTHHFCGRSCSNSYNNKKCPKVKLNKLCNASGCQVKIRSSRSYCKECNLKRNKYCLAKTVGDIRNAMSLEGKHPSWIHAQIRSMGRYEHKRILKLPCKNCGYKLHVELCHIKPLSEFRDDSKITEINNAENVVQLCRNCHWELDHGYLNLEKIFS